MKDIFEGIDIPDEKKLELLQNLLLMVTTSGQLKRPPGMIIGGEQSQSYEPSATKGEYEEPPAAFGEPDPSLEPQEFETAVEYGEIGIDDREPTAEPAPVPEVQEAPVGVDAFDISQQSFERQDSVEISPLELQSPAEMAIEAAEDFSDEQAPSKIEELEPLPLDVGSAEGLEFTTTGEILQDEMVRAQAAQAEMEAAPSPAEEDDLITEEISDEEAFRRFAAIDREEQPASESSKYAPPQPEEGGELFSPEKIAVSQGEELITEELDDNEAFRRFAELEKGSEEPKAETVIETQVETAAEEASLEEPHTSETTEEAAPDASGEISMADFFAEPSQEETAVEEQATATTKEAETIGDFFESALNGEEEEQEEEKSVADFFSDL